MDTMVRPRDTDSRLATPGLLRVTQVSLVLSQWRIRRREKLFLANNGYVYVCKEPLLPAQPTHVFWIQYFLICCYILNSAHLESETSSSFLCSLIVTSVVRYPIIIPDRQSPG